MIPPGLLWGLRTDLTIARRGTQGANALAVQGVSCVALSIQEWIGHCPLSNEGATAELAHCFSKTMKPYDVSI